MPNNNANDKVNKEYNQKIKTATFSEYLGHLGLLIIKKSTVGFVTIVKDFLISWFPNSTY